MATTLEILRTANKMSQIDVANAIGVSERTYRLIERGEQSASDEQAAKLAQLFQATKESMFSPHRYMVKEFDPKQIAG